MEFLIRAFESMSDTNANRRHSRVGSAPGWWQRLKQDRTALLSVWFLGIVLAVCFAVPPLMDASRNQPSTGIYLPPTARHALGTDANGRDLLYRVLSGGRVSIVVGFCAAAVSLLAGTLVGLISGFLGGKVDALLMRTVDVFYSMPRVLFALVLIAALDEPLRSLLYGWLAAMNDGGHVAAKEFLESVLPYSKTLVLILSLGMVEWLTMARIVRGQVLALKEREFVAAARCLGQTRLQIMRRHVLPNLSAVILTCLTLTIPVVMLDESFLSFLGLGIEEPAASWGALLKEGAGAINPIETRWWLLVFPALAMTAALLALNFLGDSLRDGLDVH
jgi:peptide/nickel transport system permease protein/oligopeptide transport system permease protein